MMELRDRLDRLAGPAVPATGAQADADLARGRRALRRRRTVKGAATGVFAVAAAVAVLAYGGGSRPAGRSAPPAVSHPAVAAANLVAYRGEQPRGYTIDKVPAGWEVQGNSALALTIAPADAADKNPDTFAGKIAVMLESKDERGAPPGTAMRVGDQPAVMYSGGSTRYGKGLYVRQPSGIYLIIQIGDARGWSDDAIVEFARGVHVLPNARQGVG